MLKGIYHSRMKYRWIVVSVYVALRECKGGRRGRESREG